MRGRDDLIFVVQKKAPLTCTVRTRGHYIECTRVTMSSKKKGVDGRHKLYPSNDIHNFY